jgi:hypothetical protein
MNAKFAKAVNMRFATITLMSLLLLGISFANTFTFQGSGANMNGDLQLNISNGNTLVFNQTFANAVVNGKWFFIYNFTPIAGTEYNFSYSINGTWYVFTATNSTKHPFGAYSYVPYVWDDMMIPLTSMRSPSTDPANCDTLFRNNVAACAFAINDNLVSNLQLSHSYALGTQIDCHIHWSSQNNNTGSVVWGLEYTKADLGSTFPTTTTIYCKQANNNTVGSYEHKLCDFHTIGNFTGLSGTVQMRLFRNITGDTYGSDAFGLSLDCHYQKDSVGSTSEFGKWS